MRKVIFRALFDGGLTHNEKMKYIANIQYAGWLIGLGDDKKGKVIISYEIGVIFEGGKSRK